MKIILFVALESEFKQRDCPDGVELYYTGVGKVNAAIKATHELSYTIFRQTYAEMLSGIRKKRTIVVNYGSAGSSDLPVGTFLEIKDFHQGDMDVSEIGFDKGVTPFDDLIYTDIRTIISFNPSNGAGTPCTTVDTFNSKTPYKVVDMEAYSIAKVCKVYGFNFVSYKFISDNGNPDDWAKNLEIGKTKFLVQLNRLIMM